MVFIEGRGGLREKRGSDHDSLPGQSGIRPPHSVFPGDLRRYPAGAQMSPTLLAVMQEHPALGVVMCSTAAVIAALGYASVRRVCTMFERISRDRRDRCTKARALPEDKDAVPVARERNEAVVTKEGELRALLGNLGYKSAEIDKVIGLIDRGEWRNDIQTILKVALKALPNRARVS